MSNKSKTETLSDKISDLLTSVPKSFDPEDDVHEETVAKIVEQEEEYDEHIEVSSSKFRRQNVDLLEDIDKRYVGKKSSRKALVDPDEVDTDEDDLMSSDEEVQATDSNEDDATEDSQSEGDMEDDDNESGEEEEFGEGKEAEENFQHISMPDSKVEKGRCVRNQLSLWESLLEMRIQLQKSLISSNKMPQLESHQHLAEDCPEFNVKVQETKKHLSSCLDKFLNLQNLLQKQYPETKNLDKPQQKEEDSDEEIPSDTEEEKSSGEEEEEARKIPNKRRKLEDFEQEIAKRHEKYSKYRNSVIQKWHDKTKLLSGKHNAQHSVINQINFILNDKPKLIKRTHLKRSQYEIIGKKCEKEEEVKEATDENEKLLEEHDPEIFDDDDFYHQLLRELIEVKSADLTDPVQLGKQWIELQNLRSKMKKKVDTRATKGRKIRYAVHSKLVNFMAPIENSTWTNDAKNELFSSLFGKNQIESL